MQVLLAIFHVWQIAGFLCDALQCLALACTETFRAVMHVFKVLASQLKHAKRHFSSDY